MKLLRLLFAMFLCCILFTSCASKKNLFVLIPDSDGKVGSITVSDKRGNQTILSSARQATEIADAKATPTQPFGLKESEITDIFGAALSAQKEFPVWRVFFRSSTTLVVKESYATVKEMVAAIQNNRSTDISIIGHTDRVGTRQANYALSMERAAKIRDILVSEGINPEYIEIRGLGEDFPLVKTEDEVPEPQNRRVEVRVR
jgi:outer membrane protein OmpA-like peptidoglycan-associated protein